MRRWTALDEPAKPALGARAPDIGPKGQKSKEAGCNPLRAAEELLQTCRGGEANRPERLKTSN